MSDPLEQRWGFMIPWCKPLEDVVECILYETRHGTWSSPTPELCVIIPSIPEAFFRLTESIKLLAAVANVNYDAWRYLLENYCHVGVEMPQNIPVDFFSVESEDLALTGLYGALRYQSPSQLYLDTLDKIAALDPNLNFQEAGLEITIPFRLYYQPEVSRRNLLEEHEKIRQAEHFIKEFCEETNENEVVQVAPGSIHCSFVVVPMMASYKNLALTPDLVEGLGNLVTPNVWFSKIEVSMFARQELVIDARAMKQGVGRLFSRLFDSAARSPELSFARYMPELDSITDMNPLQLGAIELRWDGWSRIEGFRAMCSALVRAQTTKKLKVHFEFLLSSETNLAGYNQDFSNTLWKWLAYALFSKRARVGCGVENLSLVSIGSMTTQNIEAFISIVQSDHPEELLCGCPRGVFDEREAMLTSGAPVRWQFSSDGQPVANSKMLMFESPIAFVRTFSDDGASAWMNVLTPGFGICQVRCCNLVFYESSSTSDSDGRLKSLTIGFHEFARLTLDALYSILAAVGKPLKFLEINRATSSLDILKVLGCCPNLEQLSIRGKCADIQLLPSKLRSRVEFVV